MVPALVVVGKVVTLEEAKVEVNVVLVMVLRHVAREKEAERATLLPNPGGGGMVNDHSIITPVDAEMAVVMVAAATVPIEGKGKAKVAKAAKVVAATKKKGALIEKENTHSEIIFLSLHSYYSLFFLWQFLARLLCGGPLGASPPSTIGDLNTNGVPLPPRHLVLRATLLFTDIRVLYCPCC